MSNSGAYVPPDNNQATSIAVGLNLVQAINNLNNTIKSVFPQGSAISATAGAASGNYLVVQAPDGSTYKIQLLNP